MTQAAFPFLTTIPRVEVVAAWTRYQGGAPFPRYEHVSGWAIIHCGHPTAHCPFYAVDPDGVTHYSETGRPWRKVTECKAELLERFGVEMEVEVTDG